MLTSGQKEPRIAIGAAVNHQVKRKVLSREAHPIPADQLQMTGQKEALAANHQVKRKVLNPEAHPIPADRLRMTGPKEAPIAIGVALNQQASGSFRTNPADHQNQADLKNVATILITSHSANQKTHHTTSLKLHATRMINQKCAAGKSQQPMTG